MVKIFDSHAHLDSDWYDKDRTEVIRTASAELAGIINPGTDVNTSALARSYARDYLNIYAAVGFHPHDAKNFKEQDLATFANWAQEDKVVAIGEIGLDYHYDHSPRPTQQQVFIAHLDLARQLDLPIIIHDREAHGDMLRLIKTEGKGLQGVFHCYSGSLEMAKELLKLGFYIAFGGSATFKTAEKLREVVRYIPDERILLETDAPYLSPEGFRGKRNIPQRVQVVLERLAAERRQTPEKLAEITNDNIYNLFKKIKNN